MKNIIEKYNSFLCILEEIFASNDIGNINRSNLLLEFDMLVKNRKIFQRKYDLLKNKDAEFNSDKLNFFLRNSLIFESHVSSFLYESS